MMKIAHNADYNDITLEDIQQKKNEVKENLHEEWKNITSTTGDIVNPFKKPFESSSGIIRNIKIGWLIFEGFTTGLQLMKKTRNLFHKKK